MIFFAWVSATLTINFVACHDTSSTLERFCQSLRLARVHGAHETTSRHQVTTFCRLLVHLSHGESPRDNLVEVAAQLVKVLGNLTELAELLAKLAPQRLFCAIVDALGAKACQLHLELGLLLLFLELGAASLTKTFCMLGTRHLLILVIYLLYQS